MKDQSNRVLPRMVELPEPWIETDTRSPQIARVIEIWKHIDQKVSHFDLKSARARNRENHDRYRKLFWLYRNFQHRAFLLVMNLRSPKTFGDQRFAFLNLSMSGYKQREKERVENGKSAFLSKHKFSLHFLQASLHADYGTFHCDRCGRKFYHSPSTITKATQVVYNCACGYCTNEIIGSDWNETPYK